MPARVVTTGAAPHGDLVAGQIEVLGVVVGGVEQERLGLPGADDAGQNAEVGSFDTRLHIKFQFDFDLLGCDHRDSFVLAPTVSPGRWDLGATGYRSQCPILTGSPSASLRNCW